MLKEKSMRLTSRGNIVVEYLPHYLKVEGLSPATAETGKENGKKRKSMCMT
jgi:hypothetical protein